jgi:hypothetical protein
MAVTELEIPHLITWFLLHVYRFSVHDVVTMRENDPDFMSADVYVTPPDEQGISEEDSDDEDQMVSLNHLSRQQMSTEADARIVRCTRRSAGLATTVETTTESNGSTDEDDDDEIAPAELCAESSVKKWQS